MQKQLNKILLLCLVCIFVLLGILLKENVSGDTNELAETRHASSLQVHFLDVGQGDTILIQTSYEQNILIDGGPDSTVLYGLGKVMPFYDHDIDIMILTHPHSDHVAGLVDVLKKYNVKKIYYTGVIHTTPDYLTWLEEIKLQKIPLEIIEEPKTLNLGQELKLEFIYPLESFAFTRVKELNNTSIVNKLVYKDTSFLLTGDAETEVEQELLESGFDLSADVLKAGHHGSTSSSTQEFLEAVDPKYIVIQSGQDNEYGHPHMRTIKKFERFGAQILRNDEYGTITFISDGKDIQF